MMKIIGIEAAIGSACGEPQHFEVLMKDSNGSKADLPTRPALAASQKTSL
jgi:hypothetical protein